MCGRYASGITPTEFMLLVDAICGGGEVPGGYRPSWNIAPTQMAPVLRRSGAAMLRWGLVPKWWGKDSGPINARAETAASKPMFRSAYKSRRCVVALSGFYEWRPQDKQPFYIQPAEPRPLLFAGLWEQRDELETFAILTCDANDFMQPIHHRMPVVLSDEGASHWLDHPDPSLLVPCGNAALRAHQVSKRVGNARNNDIELIAEEK